jgi:hypothetical protein
MERVMQPIKHIESPLEGAPKKRMPVQAQRYLRKPLYVDAVRITSTNFEEIAVWCQGEILKDEESGSGKKFIKVRVHNPKNPRQTKAFVGDWLLYTERGYKVYTSKAFHAAFDRVESNGTAPVSDPRLTGDPVADAKPTITTEVERLRADAGLDETIELTPANPETIAQAVRDNEAARIEEDKIQPSAAAGKRVLTEADQVRMTGEEVRELVQSGEAILAQDITHS